MDYSPSFFDQISILYFSLKALCLSHAHNQVKISQSIIFSLGVFLLHRLFSDAASRVNPSKSISTNSESNKRILNTEGEGSTTWVSTGTNPTGTAFPQY